MLLCLRFIVHFTFTGAAYEFSICSLLFCCFSVNYHFRIHKYYIWNIVLNKSMSFPHVLSVFFCICTLVKRQLTLVVRNWPYRYIYLGSAVNSMTNHHCLNGGLTL